MLSSKSNPSVPSPEPKSTVISQVLPVPTATLDILEVPARLPVREKLAAVKPVTTVEKSAVQVTWLGTPPVPLVGLDRS